MSDLKVKHRAQVLQSSTVHRYSVAFSSAVMRPSQNDPRNLTCVPIRFIGCRSSLYFCTSSRGWAFFLFGLIYALNSGFFSFERARNNFYNISFFYARYSWRRC